MSTHDVIEREPIGNEPLGEASAGDPPVVSTVARRGRTSWLWRSLALVVVALLAAVVAPLTAGAAPGGDTKKSSPGGLWLDAGWASQDDVLDGPEGATGVIELDWEADADAVTGESFELLLPTVLEPVDPSAEVQLVDDEGYLGATGVWTELSGSVALLEVTLEQDGTVLNDADEQVLLGGTASLEVTWSDKSLDSLQAGKHELTLRGEGFDGDDQITLTGRFTRSGSPESGSPTLVEQGSVTTGWGDLAWSTAALSGGLEAVAALEFDWAFAPDATAGSTVVFDLPDVLRGTRVTGDEVLREAALLTASGDEVGTATWSDSADTLVLTLTQTAEARKAAPSESAVAVTGVQKLYVGWTEEATQELDPGEHELEFLGTGKGSLTGELVASEPGAQARVSTRNAGLFGNGDHPCELGTFWQAGYNSSGGRVDRVMEFSSAGAPTGRQFFLNGSRFNSSGRTAAFGGGIAIDPTGQVMWVSYSATRVGQVDRVHYLSAYSLPSGDLIQDFPLSLYTDGVSETDVLGDYTAIDSMVFSGNRLLMARKSMPDLYTVDSLPTPVPGGSLGQSVTGYNSLSLGAFEGTNLSLTSLADGSLLVAPRQQGGLGESELAVFKRNGDGFDSVRAIGRAEHRVYSTITQPLYLSTLVVAGGLVYVASAIDNDIYAYAAADLDLNGSASTKYVFDKVYDGNSSIRYFSATSAEEAHSNCSSPDVRVSKAPGQVSGPDSNGDYFASYEVTVTNEGFAGGTYAGLTDTPVFDPSFEVKGASWSGEQSGSQSGPGPYLLDSRNVSIADRASKTYEITVRFAYEEGVHDDASSCAAVPAENRGLTNIIGLSGSSELTEDTAACLEPPAAPVVPSFGEAVWNKVAEGTGELLSGSEWTLTPIDDDGSEIIVVDCVAVTAAECEGPDTDPEAGRFLVAGLAQGDYELVETKAPAGYVLDDSPHTITVTDSASAPLDIENVQRDALVIPLTGGMGADRFLLIGGLLAALAAVGVVWRHRRQQALDVSTMT